MLEAVLDPRKSNRRPFLPSVYLVTGHPRGSIPRKMASSGFQPRENRIAAMEAPRSTGLKTRPQSFNLGKAITFVVERTGVRLGLVATRAGVDPHYLSQIIRGVRTPSLPTLEDIAHGLGVPVFVLAFYGCPDERCEPLRPLCELYLDTARAAFRTDTQAPASSGVAPTTSSADTQGP